MTRTLYYCLKNSLYCLIECYTSYNISTRVKYYLYIDFEMRLKSVLVEKKNLTYYVYCIWEMKISSYRNECNLAKFLNVSVT